MWTEYINESQNLLNRNVRGFGIALILFYYLIVFSPLWFSGFMIERKLFELKYQGSEQVLIIVSISIALYCLLFFLKGILISCKNKGNLIWIPLFGICAGFTAVVPAIVLFQTIKNPLTGAGLAVILFSLIYAHYQFHAIGSPWFGRVAYHLGISIASKF